MTANEQTSAPDSGSASVKEPLRNNDPGEKDKQFRALVQASSDVVYRMNADWTEMHQLIGRDFIADTDEVNCNWLQKYILPDDQPQVLAAINEAIRAKKVFELQHRVRRVDGSVGWTSSRAVPILDENGNIVEWFGMASDITARHETEEKLRASEELFRTIIENSRDGINMLDLTTGRYIFMSPSQVALTGFTADEILNISAEEAYERVHPDDREISVRQQQEVAAGNDNLSPAEYRWRVKSGEYRWFSDTRKIVRDAQGHAVALVGISRDITDRKQAEEMLRASEERYRLLADTMLDGIVHQSADGTIIAMNPSAERILGRTRTEFLGGSSVTNELHTVREDGSPFPGLEHPAMAALHTGQPVRGVVMGVWNPQRSERRWIEVDAVPIIAPGQAQPVEVYTVFADITDRKQIEAALAKSHAELQAKTIALEETLEQMKSVSFKLAWAEERERERIAGELHDQVGQSLLLAQMKLSALEDECPTAAQHGVLAEVRELVNRSISDIRTLTFRMRPPLLETAGLDMTFNWLCSTIGSDYGTEIEFLSDGSLKELSADLRYPLYQAVRELLVNAMKHAAAGKVQLIVRSDEHSRAITVIDNGIGFDQSTTRKEHLSKNSYGLFNVQQRIERLNGTLTIESAPGKGTLVTITIPAV